LCGRRLGLGCIDAPEASRDLIDGTSLLGELVYQPAVPVSKVLEGIHTSQYVLPAIQRESVWNTDQICKLFDSLMLEYPIGAFLFWKVESEQASKFTFYDFISDYHEKNNPFAPPRKIPAGQGATAILDGQQRLTALNIGLYGSHAERQPRKWRNNPDAFPKKRLYLNLLQTPVVDDQGLAYDFRFLSDAAAVPDGAVDGWFPVRDVLSFADAGPAIMAELERRHLTGGPPSSTPRQPPRSPACAPEACRCARSGRVSGSATIRGSTRSGVGSVP